MNRWAAAAAGAALVVAAWGVAVVTPTDDDVVRPFSVPLTLDERAVGRNLAVTVDDVSRTESVSTDEWTAEGNWVVVDLSCEATVEEGASLRLATLTIDGAIYQASERPASFFEQSLAVGIPRSGSLAFELPANISGGSATLTLGLTTDPRLDSVLTYDFDLAGLELRPTTELNATGWTTP